MDVRNLRPLQPKTCHQPFLTERDGIDVLRQGRAVRLPAAPLSTTTTLGPDPIDQPSLLCK